MNLYLLKTEQCGIGTNETNYRLHVYGVKGGWVGLTKEGGMALIFVGEGTSMTKETSDKVTTDQIKVGILSNNSPPPPQKEQGNSTEGRVGGVCREIFLIDR